MLQTAGLRPTGRGVAPGPLAAVCSKPAACSLSAAACGTYFRLSDTAVQAAARLYEAAGDHQTATALYIRAQRFEDASRLISDTGLQDHKIGLAKAREGMFILLGAFQDIAGHGVCC